VRTNLSRYLSPQIVDRIVQNNVQVNLGGDRKVVTVLFSDIRNFTTITEKRPPDQLVLILNEYFTGKWTPPVWKPSKEIEHCVKCHGPDDMFQTKEKDGMNHQQGHMECLMCHGDHTKAT
jgi:hypothetical protein